MNNHDENISKLTQAQKENDWAVAYKVFTTSETVLSIEAGKILGKHPDEIRDWVLDQLVILSRKALLKIDDINKWQAYISQAIKNRAKDRLKQSRFEIVGTDVLPEAKPETNRDSQPEPIQAEALFSGISLRDRALLKLTYATDPEDYEWFALSQKCSTSVEIIQEKLNRFLFEKEIISTKDENKITVLYYKMLKQQNEIDRKAMKLDSLLLANPQDDATIKKTMEELVLKKQTLVRTQQQYYKLQKPQRRRLKASQIADATGLTIDEIHQAVSRARKKMKENGR